jgi:7-carboxy-7-deazaguanine synthase
MSYSVKEIFYTLQGEGAQAGRPAVFCRFSGCNLWSGREVDRRKAVCTFCDTEFRGTDGAAGGVYADALALADRVCSIWPRGCDVRPYVVCTGGEPLLQLDEALIDALHERGCEIAVETNGTCAAPSGLDWICVSPKADARLELLAGDELKLVYPQAGVDPACFDHLDFRYFFLQPMAGLNVVSHTSRAIAYCKAHPSWRLSTQLHKALGIL